VKRARTRRSKARRANSGAVSCPSRLSALFVALSLIVQLFAVPYHQALATPEITQAETARIAAELKARFGDTATLCVQIDNKGAPQSPAGHFDDQCPLCRFSAETAALVTPDVPALPVRLDAAGRVLAAAPDASGIPSRAAQQNRARAPPLAV
jgi:hypothetical protein